VTSVPPEQGKDAAHPGRPGTRRRSVDECFDLGLRRRGGPWLPVSGPICAGGNGLELQFCLDVADGTVRRVSFKVTTCITLVAYAEALAERVTGISLRDAIRVTPSDLVKSLSGVPSSKQDRAVLAIRALQGVICEAARETPNPSSRRTYP
jgi:hypothetical protein